MWAKRYELSYMFQKNCTSSKLALLLDKVSRFVLFSFSGLKDKKLIKSKANLQLYIKTETCILYSREF